VVVGDPHHVRQLGHHGEVPGAADPETSDVRHGGEEEYWLGGGDAGAGGVPRDVPGYAGAGEGAGSVVTDLTAGAEDGALVIIRAGGEVLVQAVAGGTVTARTSCSLHTAVTAGEVRASLVTGTPVRLVTLVRTLRLPVTHLVTLQTPARVLTEELSVTNITVSTSHTLSLVGPVLAVLVLITDPAEVNTFSGGAGELILTLLTIRADTFGLVISRVAVKLSITLPGGRDTETVRTPEVSRFTGV